MDVVPIVARSMAQLDPISTSFPITTFPIWGIFSWTLFFSFTVAYLSAVGIKGRHIVNAEQTLNYSKDVIKEMSYLDWENPIYESIANVISALTNVPLDRLYKNVRIRQVACRTISGTCTKFSIRLNHLCENIWKNHLNCYKI